MRIDLRRLLKAGQRGVQLVARVLRQAQVVPGLRAVRIERESRLQRLLGLVELLQREQRDAFVDGGLRQLGVFLERLGKALRSAIGKLLAHLRHAAIVQPHRLRIEARLRTAPRRSRHQNQQGQRPYALHRSSSPSPCNQLFRNIVQCTRSRALENRVRAPHPARLTDGLSSPPKVGCLPCVRPVMLLIGFFPDHNEVEMRRTAVLLFAALTVSMSLPAQENFFLELGAAHLADPIEATRVATAAHHCFVGLIQVDRSDFIRQTASNHAQTWNIDGSKGLNLIPFANTEVDTNLPPYLVHSVAHRSQRRRRYVVSVEVSLPGRQRESRQLRGERVDSGHYSHGKP